MYNMNRRDYFFAKGPEMSVREIMKGDSAYEAIMGDVIKVRNSKGGFR